LISGSSRSNCSSCTSPEDNCCPASGSLHGCWLDYSRSKRQSCKNRADSSCRFSEARHGYCHFSMARSSYRSCSSPAGTLPLSGGVEQVAEPGPESRTSTRPKPAPEGACGAQVDGSGASIQHCSKDWPLRHYLREGELCRPWLIAIGDLGLPPGGSPKRRVTGKD
jgi:hypothetical protein